LPRRLGFTGDFTFLIGALGLGTLTVARAAAFTADGGGNLGAIALATNTLATHKASPVYLHQRRHL